MSRIFALALGMSLGACSSAAVLGTDDGGSGNDGGRARREGGLVVDEDGGESWTCVVTTCAGRVTLCGNCLDDDGDGLVDAHDPECLGPCDNTEGPALLAGVGGEPGGLCFSDCYWDFGNGPGNDDCRWDHRCDPFAMAPTYDPEGPACAYDGSRVGGRDCPASQSEVCRQVCRPLTPAGCDCFGCCTFDAIAERPVAEGGTHVWIGSVTEGTNVGTCTLEVLEDRALCRPCTPVYDCYNGCGRCELCVGRTELPPECTEPGPGVPPRCEGGEQPCGLRGDDECPLDTYCITGCCQPTLI